MGKFNMLLEELEANPKSSSPLTLSNLDKKTGAGSALENVYSELPAPVQADLMSPGTATRELDSIMNELLGLNIDIEVPPKPPHAQAPDEVKKPEVRTEPPEGNQKSASAVQNDPLQQNMAKNIDAIDDLLGELSTDMERMGVRTVAKGHCASCLKCITGKMITAMGQVWHPEHFVCAVCKEELGTKGFFERDGKPYCETDYQNLYSPRCAYCQGSILQNILTAMDRTWHPEHFFCTDCGELFGNVGFMEREGKPYCPKDFYRLFAPKCSGCGEAVRENYLSAADGTWHPDCFVCADCLKPFPDGCFMQLDGRVLCTQHYHSRMGTLCATCSAPILGRCISALQRRFHPEHFVCAFCLRQLSQGVFKDQGGKPYCDICHAKLFL
ncbi:paxillin [Trichomycterus rosablanca]|uniref:paxillin n=1 Tax=Trichomycterus rosablanca TaxID=2290929 RepID=UPI002F357B86